MKQGSTLFLRAVIILMGLAALALAIFGLPAMYNGGSEEFPEASRAFLAIICALYAAAVPFFFVLWQTLKLLNYIDRNQAFSELTVRALLNIRNFAIIIAILFIGCLPLLLPIAQADDAPGLVVMGMIVACAPIAVATFAAVLKKLLKEALAIKSENELTV